MSKSRSTVNKMNSFDGSSTGNLPGSVFIEEGGLLKRQSLDTFKANFGTAESSNYADLAEKYEADAEYEEGTVLAVGGDKEVTLYNNQTNVAGIVSAYPGLRLNESLEGGVYIALKGQVPCKINGEAKKGQHIVADTNGRGKAVNDLTGLVGLVLGVALENSINNTVKVKV